MIRHLTIDDFEQLLRLREVGFFQYFDPNNQEFNEAVRKRMPHTTGYFVKGQLASSIAIYPFTMNFSGKELRFGGLSGVMSAPEFRRKGHIRELIKAGFEQLRETTPWCLEYPFDPGYYARFGFQSLPNGSSVALPIAALPKAKAVEAERLSKSTLSALEPIYQIWAARYQFAVVRNNSGRENWQRLLKEFWESRERKAYLLKDAYCIFDFSYGEDEKPNRLLVHDYAFSTPLGREQLLGFLAAFQGQADIVEIYLPANDPLSWDYAAEYPKASSTLQARIISVKGALEALSSQQTGSFVMQVHDNFCPWNTTRFHVAMSEGTISLSETSKTADLSLGIGSLALLISGSVSARSAQHFGLFEGSMQAAEALSSLAAGQIPFMPKSDFF